MVYTITQHFMAKFAVNDKVSHAGSGAKGIITGVFPPRGSRQIYNVTWIGTGSEEMCLESNLVPEVKMESAFDLVANGVFGSFGDYSRINTEFKLRNTSINTISSLKASKTIFKAYQYKPLLKYLNSDNRRLLVADEVGLGKTIEAGHILMEMKSRGELHNSIIVCPKSLAGKWQYELKDKYEIKFRIYEKKSELVGDIALGTPIFAIITYEKLRASEKNDVNSAIIEKNLQLDIVICDEAHKLRNSGNATYNAVKDLLYNAKSAIFLTATPIMLGEENLYNLMHLLDPDRFDNKHVFSDLINANKPFIKALSELNAKVPFKEVLQHLQESVIRYQEYNIPDDEDEEDNIPAITYVETSVDEEYHDVPLYVKVVQELQSLPESNESRVQIQNDISSISVLNNIFSRTRKKEVTTDWSQAVRRPQTITATLSEEEQKAHDNALIAFMQDYSASHGGNLNSVDLALATKRRLLSSSIWGQTLNIEKEDLANYHDAKFDALYSIITEVCVRGNRKLIVFSTFRRTLEYLDIRLKTLGFKSALIHGNIANRDNIFKSFQYDDNVRILLSSEVGSEGLDMQFCCDLVNYDLPWNPMVVEQRIGRIDRFGQESPTVNIFTITVKGTVQEKIYNRLLSRIGIFKECIGDIEVILDRYCEKYGVPKDFLNDLEMELESSDLTDEEKNEKIDNVCRAMLIEKHNLDEINEGLTDTLTNDMYFREEIARITESGRYITEEEILSFIQTLIKSELPTCQLTKKSDNLYEFHCPDSAPGTLKKFLLQYQPPYADGKYRTFLMETAAEGSFLLTFNQDYAFHHKDIEYINAYHPFVTAAFGFFSTAETQITNSFNFNLEQTSSERLKAIPKGDYVMALYQANIEKHIYSTVQKNTLMIPVLFSTSKDEFIHDRSLSELVFGLSQKFGETSSQRTSIPADIRLDFTEEIDRIQQETVNDIRIHLDSNKALQKMRTKKYYDKRVRAIEQRIISFQESGELSQTRLIPAFEAQIRNLIEESEQKIRSIDDYSVVRIPETLMSVSLVHII